MTVEQRKANFRTLNPITATTREISEVLNRTINGGLNSVGYVTLGATLLRQPYLSLDIARKA